jgi:non-ribosomal peptide synthetase component F
LGSLVYAAWALVLSSRTGSNDVVFATTLSGRDVPIRDIGLMNGPTLASVPHRVNADPSLMVLEYLRAVQDDLWTIISHAQHGMRNALRSSGNDSGLVDTLVNILVKAPALGSGELPTMEFFTY